MKYIKLFKTYTMNENHKITLDEKLMELFYKYNTYVHDPYNYDEEKWVTDNDVLESMRMINGDGELFTNSPTPNYVEIFGDTTLVVYGYSYGLLGKYQYQYEIKVFNKKSKTKYAHILPEENPKIIDKTLISKVINGFRRIILIDASSKKFNL